jgi:hypothetical protein
MAFVQAQGLTQQQYSQDEWHSRSGSNSDDMGG